MTLLMNRRTAMTPASVAPVTPGFIRAEDAAIKRRISNIPVTDDRKSQRICDVFFRYPHDVTEKAYPFLTIDLLNVTHASERQESETQYYTTNDTYGMTDEQGYRYRNDLTYYPSTYTHEQLDAMTAKKTFISTDSFIPVDLLYQVTSYARSQDHDRQITALMLRRISPFRRGFIDIPEDGTIRRFDLLNWSTSNLLDQESAYTKRIFRKVFTLRINAEIPASDLHTINRAWGFNSIINVENHSPPTANNHYDLTEAF